MSLEHDFGDTNTVMILNLSKVECANWKSQLYSLDEVDEVVALPSFGRVLIICQNNFAAMSLMEYLHNQEIQLSVVYGPPMSCEEQASRLEVPKIERLLFISPPCSPPAGWLSTVEEPPNERTHFEQELNARLVALSQIHAAEAHATEAHSAKPHLQVEIPKTTIIVPGSETTPTISVNLAANELPSPPSQLPRTAMPA